MNALRWLASRALTLGLYILAIIGATNWDHDPNSWFLITTRLGANAMFLWWAVDRTIGHHHEDHKSADGRSEP